MVYLKTNLAEYSKERYGPRSAVLPMMMMIIIIIIMIIIIPENCYHSL
jgi:hypothetical protein